MVINVKARPISWSVHVFPDSDGAGSSLLSSGVLRMNKHTTTEISMGISKLKSSNKTPIKSKSGKNNMPLIILSDPIYWAISEVKNAFEQSSLKKKVTESEYPDQIQKNMTMLYAFENSDQLDSHDDSPETFEEILDLVGELCK